MATARLPGFDEAEHPVAIQLGVRIRALAKCAEIAQD
jgi:hypothetical protein